LSHFPVVSTVFRLAYLYFFLLVIPYLVLFLLTAGAWSIGVELRWRFFKLLSHHQDVAGLMGSDLIHWGLDVLITEHKSANSPNPMHGAKPDWLFTGYKTGIDCSIKALNSDKIPYRLLIQKDAG
jgi:hypothetical protein